MELSMKIVQLLPSISYGDAVGNDTLALYNLLYKAGYDTAIYAGNIDERLKRIYIHNYADLPDLGEEDIIVYHFAIGSDEMRRILEHTKARRLMIYHNITPAGFFDPYDQDMARGCQEGRQELRDMAGLFEACLADSAYNAEELVKAGYRCPIAVLPILIPFEDYKKKPSKLVISRYENDGYENWLFVGRIAPNKKQENVIRAFAYYKKHYNPQSRLFLVGAPVVEAYDDALKRYIGELGLSSDIVFTGHTSFADILAYYRLANAFVCMSEHEGFCVPLIEAMLFDVPVIAYSSSAIPDTLGGAGLLVDDVDGIAASRLADKLHRDDAFRKSVIEGQRERLHDFSYEEVAEEALLYFHQFVNHEENHWRIGENQPEWKQPKAGSPDNQGEKTNDIPPYSLDLIDQKIVLRIRKKNCKKRILRSAFNLVYKISPHLALLIKIRLLNKAR
ncbi:glycosyltransferase [Dialister succinatiphilus]|uniref:glycosyltransferase n=2 Tax=Dialister succinatiphilus TaxID=487173 RepID=UPI004028512D